MLERYGPAAVLPGAGPFHALLYTLPAPTFAWQQAVVGSNDRIIPPANQTRAWQESAARVASTGIAHYDEPTFKHYLQDVWINDK